MYRSLFKAAQLGDLEELARTRDDATLDAMDPARNTALHVVVMMGRDDFAKVLCKRRPLLLMKENMEGNTPLHCALKLTCDESLFIYFMNVFLAQVRDLEEGIKTGLKANGDGESLLFLAADRESLESVKLLLDD
ncbi:hypothetical protein QJS04_geneDACA019092 [Acorus gramineus]|uniref:Uncharacterized protein n=1 Tax=Acorus gramineus TaxID=55184 RepID=A0AAV9A9E6_ACOGR|nr:hypothetical protein QJS04_geneDACA019092 [Acorus gramineus]